MLEYLPSLLYDPPNAGILESGLEAIVVAMSLIAPSIQFPPNMPLKHRVFISEYMKDFNGQRAATVVGFKEPAQAAIRLLDPVKSPAVVAVIRSLVEKHEKTCELTADYVRDYIYTVMEFKPGHYFKSAGDGGWILEEEVYAQLPEKIQRLIEEIECREVNRPDGNSAKFMWIKFVSKTVAMTTAAKYTLTQKLEMQRQAVDLDAVMRKIIEKKAERAAAQQAQRQALPPIPPKESKV